MTAAVAPSACVICGAAFVSPLSRVTCGATTCRSRWQWQHRQTQVAQMRAARERCRVWAAEHRAVKGTNAWLRGAPYWPSPYLPGGACQITIRPAPRWPLEHRNVRLLHGALSTIAAVPHDRACPTFALVPANVGCGWYVHWWSEEVAARVAARAHEARVARQPVTVQLGPLVRVKVPPRPDRGRKRMRVDAITPVVISRDGKQTVYTAPTTERLVSTLTNNLGRRFGLAMRMGLDETEIADVRVELVERDTQPAAVPTGGHAGTIRGWVGSVVVEANASARWLLECAARGLGLGGRTAFGFGRIRVERVS